VLLIKQKIFPWIIKELWEFPLHFFINSILKNNDLKPENILKIFDELSLEARINSTLNPCLDELYEIGSSKIEKEFSLERVLTQLRQLKVIMK
jgi:hypothetical protein